MFASLWCKSFIGLRGVSSSCIDFLKMLFTWPCQADDDDGNCEVIALPDGPDFPMLGESLKRANDITGKIEEGVTKRAAAGQLYKK